MKPVQILKDTIADGEPVKQGEIVEISDAGATVLITLLKAVISEGTEEPAPSTTKSENADSGSSKASTKPKTSKARKT